MLTAKEWFEEELSEEPLTQESVIEVIKMVQKETWNEALDEATESADFGICQNDNGCPCIQDSHFIDKDSILKLKI